ncbi:MAG TPA: sensor histidine kinase [Cyclobacteriaceae bacterium]|nr:sensor histidine kinase [Cyclobacteriaceae bacterium]
MDQTHETQVFLLIAIGTGGMLILAGAIVLFITFYQKRMVEARLKQQLLESQFQQKVLEATLDSQESERSRVAGDLHDSIGGMLSAIRMGLSAIGRQLPNPHVMDAQKQMLDDTIESVRKISRELMPATLEKFGLIPAVRELCEKMQATTQIQIGLMELGETRPIENRRQLMVYRITQELLNNAFKHSKATYIEVVFEFKEKLYLFVEDNGIGIDPKHMQESGRKSLGLFNIQSRVQLLSATVTIDPDKKVGSKISVSVPYE